MCKKNYLNYLLELLENVDFIRTNRVPGNKSYADVAMSRKTKNGITKKVIVFGYSIIRGIRVREFNQQVKNGYAKFKYFPGCNSKGIIGKNSNILSQY